MAKEGILKTHAKEKDGHTVGKKCVTVKVLDLK